MKSFKLRRNSRKHTAAKTRLDRANKEEKRAIVTRFDLAQGSHQAEMEKVENYITRKFEQKKQKTIDSIRNKELVLLGLNKK